MTVCFACRQPASVQCFDCGIWLCNSQSCSHSVFIPGVGDRYLCGKHAQERQAAAERQAEQDRQRQAAHQHYHDQRRLLETAQQEYQALKAQYICPYCHGAGHTTEEILITKRAGAPKPRRRDYDRGGEGNYQYQVAMRMWKDDDSPDDPARCTPVVDSRRIEVPCTNHCDRGMLAGWPRAYEQLRQKWQTLLEPDFLRYIASGGYPKDVYM